MTGPPPGREHLNEIAQQAERDLNTYQSKTGTGKGRVSGLDDYGVNDPVEKKFPGSTVKAGDDLVTNRSYDRPIPPDEGGDVDDKGRFVRGSAYEGAGGPEDKTARAYQRNPGGIDEGTVRGWGKDPREVEGAALRRAGDDVLPADQSVARRGREPIGQGEVSEQGRRAAETNVGLSTESRGELPSQGKKGSGSRFKGAYYEASEFVPDQRADQGNVPPRSVTETSKTT